MVYGVVGSLNAPFYFAVGNRSGEVTTINDLKTDIKQQYDVSTMFSCLVLLDRLMPWALLIEFSNTFSLRKN
jgi:hypothetical protein